MKKILKTTILGTLIIITTVIISAEIFPNSMTVSAQASSVPDWVRNSAGWWSQGLIPTGEYINSLQWLIDNEIIRVGGAAAEESTGTPVLVQGTYYKYELAEDANGSFGASLRCDPGDVATGGGAGIITDGDSILRLRPHFDSGSDIPIGWNVKNALSGYIDLYVVCLDLTP